MPGRKEISHQEADISRDEVPSAQSEDKGPWEKKAFYIFKLKKHTMSWAYGSAGRLLG